MAADLLKSGEFQSAQTLLIATLKTRPDLDLGWFLLSFTFQRTDQKTYALKQALRLNPELEVAHQRLRALENESSQHSHSSEFPIEGNYAPLLLADALIDQDQLQAAQKVLREFLRAHPDEAEGWYLLSFAETDKRAKINTLRQASRLDPACEKSRLRLQELQEFPIQSTKITPTAKKRITQIRTVTVPRTFAGLTRYIFQRALMILATIVIGIYLTVLITNKGGQIDMDVQRQIDRQVNLLRFSHEFDDLSREEKQTRLEEIRWELEESIGLHLLPALRNVRWTFNALRFQWGKVIYLGNMNLRFGSSSEIDQVKVLILQYLPNTLMLFGVANLFVLFLGIPLALFLASRGKNGFLDRFISMLSPLSSVPSWVHGIILVTIFAVVLGILPVGGKYDKIPPETSLGYIPIVAKHMLLPVMAIFLSMFFQLVYSWRTYFLIYSDEDYVELARAKGLAPRMLERRYILRPTMPYIITGFALTLVGFWQMSTALETFFNWPGIGLLYVKALPNFWGENFFPGEVSIILSVVVLFAFLLGFVVFILDVSYAVLDPRVRLGHSMNGNMQMKSSSSRHFRGFRRKRKSKATSKRFTETLAPPSISVSQQLRLFFVNLKLAFRQNWQWLKNLFSEIRKYPSAIMGISIITMLVGASLYTVIALPYMEIGAEWRGANITGQSYLPKNVPPKWTNWFRQDDLPTTIVLSNREHSLSKTIRDPGNGFPEYYFTGTIDYAFDTFPQDVYLYIDTSYQEKRPHISITWTTPDGREINPKSPTSSTGMIYDFSENLYVSRPVRQNENWKSWFVLEGQNHTPEFYYLFADPEATTPQALPGTYQIEISALTFEEGTEVDLELVIFGGVHGLAGTDYLRRDLTVPLLWGLPFTLAFGVTGAIVTTVLAMIVAAAGVWFGGWFDGLVQRITEANMILPVLAVGILVFAFYDISLWTIMGIIILLNVFGSPTKIFRAAFLQVKEAPYIEAARTYGASNARIIFKYMIPKIIPVLIPQLVMLIPALVFLEATLGIFNVFDPRYPTWGRVIYEAITRASLWGGSAYWYLEPIGLLLLVGVAFALFGFALERILNPRLQDR
jgi:peptide/nickel transport system permease protein